MRRTLLPLAVLLLAGLTALAADPPAAPLPPARQLAVARPVNPDDVRRHLGLLPDYASVPRLKDVRVAVLDYGFAGVDGVRPYLPKNAVVVEHYDRDFIRRFDLGDPEYIKPLDPANPHGRQMAQLVWAAAGNHPDGPQFFLLNANGPTLFRRAVRFAIELKVDVILFSGTFEGAGNYDGRGPINAAVDEAVAAGIVWVNAAGNCGGMVFNGPADVGPGGYLRFGPAALTALRFANRFDENTVTVTLTWNDYRDAEDAGTDKDLDLIVEDVSGRLVGESKLAQVPAGQPAGDGQTKNPRERVVLADLPAVRPGWEYRIRVRAKAGQFGPRDRVRVLVSSAKDAPYIDPATGKMMPPVEFLDATPGGEIYPPADHPGVLTVGDTSRSSAVGPTADGRVKPDVVLGLSLARFSNGEETGGSSNAAAYFAGVVAVLRAHEPALTTGHIREWVRRLDQGAAGKPGPVAAPARPVALLSPPPPAAFPPGLPPPAPPLTPNQQRAMRYAEGSVEDTRRQKGLPPLIEISTPRGSLQIYRGGQPLPPPAPVPAPVAAVGPPPAAPAPARDAGKAGREPPHALWVTPSPKALAELVRGP